MPHRSPIAARRHQAGPRAGRKPSRHHLVAASRPVAVAVHLAVAGLSLQAGMANGQAAGASQTGAATQRTYNIPAGPLSAAINRFVAESGAFVAADGALTQGKTSGAVQGSFNVSDALARLLAGSGLEAVSTGTGSYALRSLQLAPPKPSAVAQPAVASVAQADVELAPVTVRGTNDASGRGESAGYLPVRPSTGGNKLDLAIREQPNVIQIVPRQLFEDQGATTVHQALETVAGVTPVAPGFNSSAGAGIRSRGFENQDIFVNGARLGQFGHPLDTANIQQLEVLKGPASIEYGLTDPGGTLNIVTKRPVAEPMAGGRFIVGSFDTYRAELDVGGAVGSSGNVLTRLNIAAEENKDHLDFDKTRRLLIAPAATFVLGPNTTLDVELDYLHDQSRLINTLIAKPFILKLPFNRTFGEPNQPLSTNDSYNLFYNLQHQLGDSGWKVRQRIAYLHTDSDVYRFNLGSDIDAAGNLARNYSTYSNRDRYWTVQHELAGEFFTGSVKHKVVFGSEFSKTDFGYAQYYVADPARDAPPLNVFNPSYGGYVFPTGSELSLGYPPEHYGNRIAALYADWHATLTPQLKLLAGLRYDRTRGFYETLDGSVNYGASSANGLSPRAGVVWTPLPEMDVFANYSSGFVPQIFADAAGELFTQPEKSRQYEAGLRYEFVPKRLRGTAAAYSITKTNVQVPDPTDPTGTHSRLSGEQKSDGFELELTGAVTPRWDITAGFARVNARVTKDTVAANIGVALVDAPRNHATLFTKYKLSEALQGWWVGYGLARVSDRVAVDGTPSFLLPAYTRQDLAVGWAAGPLAAQINLGNVTDQRIYYSEGGGVQLQPGRNVKLTMEYKFR